MTGLPGIAAIVVVIVLTSLLGLLLVRRAVPHDRLSQHTDVAGYVYAVIGVIYAVILAQVVIAAWDEYRDARLVVDAEANAVLNLSRLSRVWPEEQTLVQTALGAYARHVVEVEWPAMARGDYIQTEHTSPLRGLWQVVGEAGQRATDDGATFSAALQQLDALDAARRNRALLGEAGLPEAMTLTLIVGAVITVGFSYLFAVENGWMHGLMTASLATLVALLLLLEYQLEAPFQGVSAIQPAAMEFVLAEIDSELNNPPSPTPSPSGPGAGG
jgi:hypothetical protein